MKEILQKPKFLWIFIKRNANAIMAICAFIAIAISLYTIIPRNSRNEETYFSKRPNIKIQSMYLKTIPYQAADGSQSLALKFYIPIRNEGDAIAYDIEIKKKELRLVRGPYDLNTPSLQTFYTNSRFNLKPDEVIEDTIFIDESPAYMQKVMDGKESFLLKYEIHFYGEKKSVHEKLKREPFIYEYESKFSKGQFQVVNENLHQDIKP